MHFIGHVSDEELVAYYEVADLFLCASEHEGFCVPLVEAFYKQVPVLAYAATAVPATMDGAGVLFDDKDPMHVARADGRDPVERGRCRMRSSTGSSPPSIGCRPRTSPARCSDSSTRSSSRPRAPHRASPSTSGSSSTPPRSSKSCASYRPVDLQGAAGGADDRQPVGAGGAQGRRDRRQRAARARAAARAWVTSPSSTR